MIIIEAVFHRMFHVLAVCVSYATFVWVARSCVIATLIHIILGRRNCLGELCCVTVQLQTVFVKCFYKVMFLYHWWLFQLTAFSFAIDCTYSFKTTFIIVQACTECLRVDTLKGRCINIQLHYITIIWHNGVLWLMEWITLKVTSVYSSEYLCAQNACTQKTVCCQDNLKLSGSW